MSNENFDIQEMMAAARSMQEKMQQAQEKISQTNYTGSSQDKRLTITMSGAYKVLDLKIEDSSLFEEENEAALSQCLKEALDAVMDAIDQDSRSQLSDMQSEFGELPE